MSDTGSWEPLVSVFFRIFQLWHLITRKRKQISKFRKILSRSERQDLSVVRFSWRSVKQCRSYCPFNVVFSYFSTLTFNISESIIAREIIPAGTCCIWCGKYDGSIENFFRATFFFQNGCHYVEMPTLCDWDENLHFGVLWCGGHDGNIEILFRAAIIFKIAAISRNIHFVGFQWKFRSWGNLMWRTWLCYRNCFL